MQTGSWRWVDRQTATGCLIAVLFVESLHKQDENFTRRIEGAQQMSPGKILQTAGRRRWKQKVWHLSVGKSYKGTGREQTMQLSRGTNKKSAPLAAAHMSAF